MRLSLRRPAPATIISLVALGAALGGTSYAAATIGTADLQSNAVTSAKIKNGAVKVVDLANGAVGSGKIRANAVTGPKIKPAAVTTAKLADGSVTTPKLADGSVTTPKLADAAVTAPKLGADAVTGPAIKDGSVASADVADGSLLAADVKAGELVTGAGAVSANVLSLANGAADQTVLELPGFARLTASCAAGVTTTKIVNTGQSVLSTVDAGLFRDAANPADPAVKGDVDQVHVLNAVGPGATATQDANQGTGGIQAVQWQIHTTDAAGVKHVATIWTTAFATATDCSVTAQALATP